MERRIKVYCYYNDGEQCLTDNQYMEQLSEADIEWKCPICGKIASWVGIDHQCPNCQMWVSEDEEAEVCPHCEICMCCNGKGAPEIDDGQCPICGALAIE